MFLVIHLLEMLISLLLDKNNNFDTFSLNLGVSAGSTFVDYKLLTSIENPPKNIYSGRFAKIFLKFYRKFLF